jgi:hypothetical protein
LIRLIRPPDQVRHGPYEADFFTEIIHLSPEPEGIIGKRLNQGKFTGFEDAFCECLRLWYKSELPKN